MNSGGLRDGWDKNISGWCKPLKHFYNTAVCNLKNHFMANTDICGY